MSLTHSGSPSTLRLTATLRRHRFLDLAALILIAGCLATLGAAPPDRITRAVDVRQHRALTGNLHRLAQSQFDQGPVDAGMRMGYMLLIVKPSAAQQADLDQLLVNQQNPSSPFFHKWLTPEEFGDRFGLSPADHAKVTAWLTGEGLTVNESGRARNWIAFSGSAGQVSKALHTSIHRFQVGTETHFSNAAEPSAPDALADVVGGFLGLNDFQLKPFARPVEPSYNTGSSHYLTPEDYGTIYNLAPLYQAGMDGTGQSIAIVGQSDVLLSDVRAFRTRYHLPANDPIMLPYGTTDPGYTSAQLEGNLDLEWAGAIAPKATIYYIYGTSAFTAIVTAINADVAPIVSISYGACEVEASVSYYRAIAQQANAQGITLLSASGDSGAAGCDQQGSEPLATRGRSVDFPAVMPEVTAVGGTQFAEGTGTYWATANSANLGSALSYIPEAAWNESGTAGLLSTGGGASLLYPKPVWQTGPGVPNDNARDVPDVALSAAGHDAYYVYYLGGNSGVYGTSASAPSMAGIVALLNQYQISKKFQTQPGLGNINPQLYRLAQSAPSAFHDVAAGGNAVSCAQGSPDCLTGSFGYPAGPGYDMATGLGSVDANALVTQWNTQANTATVTLSTSTARATLNDTVQATATVTAAAGSAPPTGTVAFSMGGLSLGNVTLDNQQTATVPVPLYPFGTGAFELVAQYSGDAEFSSAGAVRIVQVTLPSRVAAIVPSGPNTVWPEPPDSQGLSWQATLTLREAAGVPAVITGVTIDGAPQPVSQYFPSPEIPASSSLSTVIVLRNLPAPVTRTFGFTGVDASGQTWSRQVAVNFFPLPLLNTFGMAASPATVAQNTADSACPWPVQVNLTDLGGYLNVITALYAGGVNLTSQVPAIFGTTRLEAWGSLQGTVCFKGVTPPSSDTLEVNLSGGTAQQVSVSFAGPPPTPNKVTATPASISLAAPAAAQPAQTTLALALTDKTQSWTAAIYPANRTTAWLSVSQLSGTGPAQIMLTANGTGFEPGVYRATITIQAANAVPQSLNVPVMFVLGGSGSGTVITAVANSATYQPSGSPGMLLSVFGSNLANTTQTVSVSPLPYSTAGVSATINGLAAPLVYVSQNQLNLQVPYAAGAGPAVLGINNNGQIAGFAFQIAPSAPGIFADAGGNLVPTASVAQGGVTTLYATGAGEVSPALKTAYSPVAGTVVSSLPKPLLPLSVTVGGVPAFLTYVGNSPGLIGAIQVNFQLPASVPAGVQPVVLTVGGVSSPPVNIAVTTPAPVSPSAEPAAAVPAGRFRE